MPSNMGMASLLELEYDNAVSPGVRAVDDPAKSPIARYQSTGLHLSSGIIACHTTMKERIMNDESLFDQLPERNPVSPSIYR
ncbi:hypothetical protein CPAR01_05515 [Colletotrichum paranaense]|uniref:Uncharacterized protein n=1 Tax=Colletotrichum paranaense TaxID=1914294 RepID=A0ABQ9SRH2_9PEZI|nr:uncharacterized protein CPAR01_05515 [Colletotrichum paranaense]KAK1542128.1 hypothetical protein CPAR01_05515 [Colletotrichum paranaense]